MAEVIENEEATILKEKEVIPEQHEQMFRNLQGNILKGHGREYSRCISFRLNEPDNEPNCEIRGHFRKFLAMLANKQFITSAWKEHIESQDFRNYRIPGTIFCNVFLTANGYKKLEFENADLQTFLKATPYFLDGMSSQHSQNNLNDPPPETWEAGYKDGRIDAMILLADNSEEFLDRETRRLVTDLKEFSEILACERGNVLKKYGRSVEHFGYVDGLSQPIFLGTDTDLPVPENRKPWDPTAPLEVVLVEDRLAKNKGCFGSYFVFRKLEQDVIGFGHGKRNLAKQFGLKESDLGAMMFGRFEDGTPVVQSKSRTSGGPSDNNFTYAGPSGAQCPVYAHIRATNPRDGTQQRIARRGIPYGKRASWDTLPTEPVGLLFMCFQASIDDQFVHIQQQAIKKHDPLLGQEPGRSDPPSRELPAHLRQVKPSVEVDTNWVKLRGGEFFFAPSIPFFKSLADPKQTT